MNNTHRAAKRDMASAAVPVRHFSDSRAVAHKAAHCSRQGYARIGGRSMCIHGVEESCRDRSDIHWQSTHLFNKLVLVGWRRLIYSSDVRALALDFGSRSPRSTGLRIAISAGRNNLDSVHCCASAQHPGSRKANSIKMRLHTRPHCLYCTHGLKTQQSLWVRAGRGNISATLQFETGQAELPVQAQLSTPFESHPVTTSNGHIIDQRVHEAGFGCMLRSPGMVKRDLRDRHPEKHERSRDVWGEHTQLRTRKWYEESLTIAPWCAAVPITPP
jgi:hypothetical protein